MSLNFKFKKTLIQNERKKQNISIFYKFKYLMNKRLIKSDITKDERKCGKIFYF